MVQCYLHKITSKYAKTLAINLLILQDKQEQYNFSSCVADSCECPVSFPMHFPIAQSALPFRPNPGLFSSPFMFCLFFLSLFPFCSRLMTGIVVNHLTGRMDQQVADELKIDNLAHQHMNYEDRKAMRMINNIVKSLIQFALVRKIEFK